MTSTESSPKQETFLNLPRQFFGCFHGNEAAHPAALPSARAFPKLHMDQQHHAFVAPLPKASLFSAQGHSNLLLSASPWFWKHLAREGIHPCVLPCTDSGQGGTADGYASYAWRGQWFPTFLPWKDVLDDGKGEHCRGQEHKQSRKKENPDFCLVSQKNRTETWHLWP